VSVLLEEFVLSSNDEEPKNDPAKSEKAKLKEATKSEPKVDVKPKAEDKPAAEPQVEAPKADALSGPARAKAMLRDMKSSPNLKSTLIKVVAVVVALLVVVIVVFGVLIYGYKSENSVVRAVAQVIPYPIQRVNRHFVSYNDYLFEVEANKRAYQNNAKLNNQPAVDFNSADGKKLVVQIKQHSLDKVESDALVAQLAAQKKVTVTDKQINDLINQLYSRYGGKDTLLKTLNQIYGWDLGNLKTVVRKQLLAQNLQTKVTSDPAVDAAAKAKAQDVLKKVKDGGDFAALAKQYSQASDAASGGDLGFFTKGQLPDELFAAAQALQPGQVSDTIKDQYGYEILKVTEKKDDGSIHASHILIKTVDFNEYFQDQLKKAKVNTYIKI
jgi:hypothetical protein